MYFGLSCSCTCPEFKEIPPPPLKPELAQTGNSSFPQPNSTTMKEYSTTNEGTRPTINNSTNEPKISATKEKFMPLMKHSEEISVISSQNDQLGWMVGPPKPIPKNFS
jgi:Leucine-rich repeat (LRR) protein